MTAAVPGVWARRTLLDTDRYVATVDELATQPAIQQALATEITAAVFEALDVQDRLSTVIGERLPELRFLAGPISTAIQSFVQEQVLKVVQSEAFITFWSEANRFVHEQALAVLRGESEAVTVQGDQVVLSYLPLVNRALADLSGLLSDLLGRSITLPTITEGMVPTEAISKLETALGVDLPENFGQVVIYEGDDLGALQQVFRMTNAIVVLLVLLILVLSAVAIAVSPRRRRTILQLAVGILVITVFERRLAISGTNSIVEDVPATFQPAAEATGQVLLDSLLSTTLWILLAMLAVIVAAVLSGPVPVGRGLPRVGPRRGVGDRRRRARRGPQPGRGVDRRSPRRRDGRRRHRRRRDLAHRRPVVRRSLPARGRGRDRGVPRVPPRGGGRRAGLDTSRRWMSIPHAATVSPRRRSASNV